LEELNQVWVPVFKNWQLNERHYGHLTGLNKIEMEKKFSPEEVKKWRKSYDYLPRPVGNDNKLWSGLDDRYKEIEEKKLPVGESLKDTVGRVSEFWDKIIFPHIQNNKKLIISAHGNSIRALLMYIEGISPKAIEEVNIPRATPILLKFDYQNKIISREFLYETNEIEN
jgi:2,3-bisphosphoglycerate-dependent phosphoglycerate mutase